MKFIKKIQILILLTFFLLSSNFAFAQTATPTPTPGPDTSALQAKINDLQSKINDLQGQERTFSSQIAVMNNQIQLTEYQIQSTEQQITDLTLDIDTATKKIDTLQASLNNSIGVLLNRISATYEVGTIQPLEILLTSSNASDFLSRLNYLRLAQAHDKQLVYQTQQAKTDYSNQKAIYEDKKKKIEALKVQLESYNQQLDSEKQAKQVLLAQTQGSEANYQKILADTKAQLAGFSRFVTSQGGASLLSGQTSCDDWGCYYNQRDNQWGASALNSTEYTLASDGCLVTAMAMVYTHYGHRDITPQSINSVSSNFSGIPAALLKYSIVANGVSAQRISASIDSTLSGGDPVIVGVHAYGGTHFVVLVSGSGGSYLMNDPFVANGHKVNFTSYYSIGSIYEIDRVSM